MYFIGDIHGTFPVYLNIVSRLEGESIQVGDMGIKSNCDLPQLAGNHKFIRGNHDDPELCRRHPNYLGDFGVRDGMFFVGGAHSPDEGKRHVMVDWWPDEELTWKQWNDCVDLYSETRPDIVVTHDCPTSVAVDFFDIHGQSSTKKGLQALFDIHQPSLWVFGHHHRSLRRRKDGTRFVCVGEYQVFDSNDSPDNDFLTGV